ncbi:hypothetical protein CRM22_008823 [Opisthorchis felineus]|uniref:Uncharacterized protein n=1 Tax=Opisthorchis felineus TaxID=147828 RepID=A0A4V3SD93_OPIFE|nr:hypothetical protein CRM22_008823 [Opisthorchis felineus]
MPKETEDSVSNGYLIYLAAANGDSEKIEDLLKIDQNITYVDETTGMMPVHIAAAWGNPKCLEVLVNNGADINQHDELLCTPMHHAARNGHTQTFEWLRDHGANVTVRNLFGQSPADMALANDFPDLADQIRRFGLRKTKAPSGNTLGDRAEAQQIGQTDQTDA